MRFLIGIPCAAALALAMAGGCLSPETIRRIEGTPGQEGTGIMLSRLPAVIKILATYPASEEQAEVAEARARTAQADMDPDELPRYLAVDTEPDDRFQGAAAVMLWDTQTEEIVGEQVYDVEAPPAPGDISQWDTITARYVGSGRAGRG